MKNSGLISEPQNKKRQKIETFLKPFSKDSPVSTEKITSRGEGIDLGVSMMKARAETEILDSEFL